jgi:hypothetical protein
MAGEGRQILPAWATMVNGCTFEHFVQKYNHSPFGLIADSQFRPAYFPLSLSAG